jgi:molybdopterin-guanine dinucleotide biosynthesis protein A
MISDCTAVILAGGDSKRMGSDKTNLMLGEQTLLQRAIATTEKIFPQVIISVRQLRPEINLPQVCDEKLDGGPLAGLTASLAHVTTPWAFMLACDMPFVEPAMIELLAEYRGKYQAVVPVVQGHPQTLAAFYAGSCLASIREHLAAGEKNSLRAVLERLQVRYVDEAELMKADPALRSFFDLDTPQDVALAMSGDVKT